MTDDLVQLLRDDAENLSPSGEYWVCQHLHKAADRIEAQRREIDELVRTLQSVSDREDALDDALCQIRDLPDEGPNPTIEVARDIAHMALLKGTK